MANEQNLIPNEARTPTERRENARKAGRASGVVRRRKKTFRELAEMVGNLKVTNERMKIALRDAGIEDEDMTNDVAMFFGLQVRAQKGDPSAAKLLAELRGLYSTRVEVEPVQPKPLIDLTEAKPAKVTKKKTGGKK